MAETLLRFEQAVLPHLDAAYNLARWLLRDSHDAEDIVQQSYLLAFRGYERFRGGDVRAWVLAIVRNACYSHLRRQRGPKTQALDDGLVESDGVGDPQFALERAIDREALMAAIEDLPAVFREVFVLREMEGLTYQQIADVAAVPVGTVMSRLARARQRLAEALKDQAPTEK